MDEADLDWLLNRFISFGDAIGTEDLRRVQDIVAHCKATLADEATHDG